MGLEVIGVDVDAPADAGISGKLLDRWHGLLQYRAQCLVVLRDKTQLRAVATNTACHQCRHRPDTRQRIKTTRSFQYRPDFFKLRERLLGIRGLQNLVPLVRERFSNSSRCSRQFGLEHRRRTRREKSGMSPFFTRVVRRFPGRGRGDATRPTRSGGRPHRPVLRSILAW